MQAREQMGRLCYLLVKMVPPHDDKLLPVFIIISIPVFLSASLI